MMKFTGKSKIIPYATVALAAFLLGLFFESMHDKPFVVETIYNGDAKPERDTQTEIASESAAAENEPDNEPEVDANGIININTADAETLDTLDGIGLNTAERIIEYRNEHGDFESIEELVNVSGIGAKKLDAIRDKITVVQGDANGS